jgi:hypothetical protein
MWELAAGVWWAACLVLFVRLSLRGPSRWNPAPAVIGVLGLIVLTIAAPQDARTLAWLLIAAGAVA